MPTPPIRIPGVRSRWRALGFALAGAAWPSRAPSAPPRSTSKTSPSAPSGSPRRATASPSAISPRGCATITYDQWRDIRFRADRALFLDRNLPFTIHFFHPGFFYDRSVRVNVVTNAGVSSVPFSPDMFDYGKNEFGSRIPQDLGFAGLRIHYPIKKPSYRDEVIVFLGASYFRAVGRDQAYGLSARGLAIDTAQPSGEEFPWFREFWLVRPAPGAQELTIYALLDSPSAGGAYRFVVAPGPGDARGRRDADLPAPRDQEARRGRADEHVPARRERRRADRRLSPRGARFRRPVDRGAQRGVAVAAAREPAAR